MRLAWRASPQPLPVSLWRGHQPVLAVFCKLVITLNYWLSSSDQFWYSMTAWLSQPPIKVSFCPPKNISHKTIEVSESLAVRDVWMNQANITQSSRKTISMDKLSWRNGNMEYGRSLIDVQISADNNGINVLNWDLINDFDPIFIELRPHFFLQTWIKTVRGLCSTQVHCTLYRPSAATDTLIPQIKLRDEH